MTQGSGRKRPSSPGGSPHDLPVTAGPLDLQPQHRLTRAIELGLRGSKKHSS